MPGFITALTRNPNKIKGLNASFWHKSRVNLGNLEERPMFGFDMQITQDKQVSVGTG